MGETSKGPETTVNRGLKTDVPETVMHLQSYRLRPDVNGDRFMHSSHCVALTAAGKKVRYASVLTKSMLF